MAEPISAFLSVLQYHLATTLHPHHPHPLRPLHLCTLCALCTLFLCCALCRPPPFCALRLYTLRTLCPSAYLLNAYLRPLRKASCALFALCALCLSAPSASSPLLLLPSLPSAPSAHPLYPSALSAPLLCTSAVLRHINALGLLWVK
jgi:hypothetical protein